MKASSFDIGTIWSNFAYRHRPSAYLLVFFSTLVLAIIYASVLLGPAGIASPSTWAWWVAGTLTILSVGLWLLVFAIPSRSPWD
jgi:hypothetical protein